MICAFAIIHALDTINDFLYITLEPGLPYYEPQHYGYRYHTPQIFLNEIMIQLGTTWKHVNNITDLPWIFKDNDRTITFYHSTNFNKPLSPVIMNHLETMENIWIAGWCPDVAMVKKYCKNLVKGYVTGGCMEGVEYELELDYILVCDFQWSPENKCWIPLDPDECEFDRLDGISETIDVYEEITIRNGILCNSI
jgi:hypothetical protein